MYFHNSFYRSIDTVLLLAEIIKTEISLKKKLFFLDGNKL